MSGLRRFLVRRLLTFIPTILGVTLLVFVIAYAIPADPAKAWIGGGEKVKPEYVEKIRKEYHMD
ncbi:MAG: ABC transporter permease, partial [Thermoplasmata archaeon]